MLPEIEPWTPEIYRAMINRYRSGGIFNLDERPPLMVGQVWTWPIRMYAQSVLNPGKLIRTGEVTLKEAMITEIMVGHEPALAPTAFLVSGPRSPWRPYPLEGIDDAQ